MLLSLDEWQEYEELHFDELARARYGSGFPLFALEHNLGQQELDSIGILLKARLREGARLSRHWLLWVIYATELGYDYDGAEYWTSFEDRTPGWWQIVTSTRRNQLREWFGKFQTIYEGVRPTGPWAKHFSIIAWPITHAILPKYLQWQFARTLFGLRYQLAHLESTAPAFLGSLLAANAWDTSSRFQEFAQQEELTGRIMLALLSDKEVEGPSPIFPSMLKRIVGDLEQVQNAREWLKETRHLVADRLKGAARMRDEAPGGFETRTTAVTARSPLHLRPTVTLRRSLNAAWSAVLDIPSFAPAGKANVELRAFLASTRCHVAGIEDGWLARGWLLSGPRKRVLKSWPPSDAPLIGFEQTNEHLVQLVNAEARLPVGPIWLFRIGNDGIARPVLTRLVRPGGKYVILSETPVVERAPLVTSSTIECIGVHAVALSVPATLSSYDLGVLEHLGLGVARTIRIAPAGLIARSWDGEGDSEWLTTETPCFGIVCDHPLDHYKIRLGGGAETTIPAAPVGAPIFLKVSALPPGKHTLTVRGRRQSLDVAEVEGNVTLNIREPEPWVPGTTAHAGLVVTLDPPNPPLDTFWEGEVGLSILGPAGYTVTCSVSLVSASGTELLSEPIATLPLPVSNADWEKQYLPFVRHDRRAWVYPEAATGRFVIAGEELGEYTLALERNVKPVRWAYRTLQRAATLRLIDECGMDTDAVCRLFSFATPAQPITLDATSVQKAFEIDPPGGLFEVQLGEFTDTIIASPQIKGGLESLASQPDVGALYTPAFDVFELLSLLSLWSEARAVGPLIALRHARVLQRLQNCLYSVLCGNGWAQAEDIYLGNPGSESALQRLMHSVGEPYGFALVLRREFDRMDAGKETGVRWFTQVAARYHASPDEGFCEFVLRLASVPYQLLRWPRPAIEPLFREIKERSVLLRGARLVALSFRNRQPATGWPTDPEVAMVITQLFAADVLLLSRQTLGLSSSAGTLINDVLVAALVRRAAGFLCPCATVTLASAVLEALRLLTDEPEVLRKRAAEAVENLIIFGDLLELNQVTVDDPSVKGTWVFAAPPSFVVRPSGSIFVLGIVADEASPLPASLNDRIMYEGFTRILVPEADENLPASLNNLGLRQISQRVWRKSPHPEPATELREQMLGRLRKQTESGAISDIRIIDSTRNVRFYDQRWVVPHNESGEFVARRPQAYGAPLWGFAQLEKGTVTRFLDFPLKGQRWRGCDVAWHLQAAIDYCRGTAQLYRKRPTTGGMCFDFFSPLPQWASRGLAVVGRVATPENSLFSYWIPEREAPTEEEFLVKHLWLAASSE